MKRLALTFSAVLLVAMFARADAINTFDTDSGQPFESGDAVITYNAGGWYDMSVNTGSAYLLGDVTGVVGDELYFTFDILGDMTGVTNMSMQVQCDGGVNDYISTSLNQNYTTWTTVQVAMISSLSGVSKLDLCYFKPQAGSTKTFSIDNVGLVVPEPASLAVLGLGAFVMLARRRR